MEHNEYSDKNFTYPPFLGAFLGAYGIKDSLVLGATGEGCKDLINMTMGFHDITGEFFSKYILSNTEQRHILDDPEEHIKKFVLENFEHFKNQPIIFLFVISFIELLGIDFDYLIPELKKSVSSHFIFLRTPSYSGDIFYGFSEVVKSIFNHFHDSNQKKQKKDNKTVNIIGYFLSRYEQDELSNIAELKRIFKFLDIKINTLMFSGEDFSKYNFPSMNRAAYNLIFPFAYTMQDEFEPEARDSDLVFVNYPLGIKSSEFFLKKVGELFDVKDKVEKIIKHEKNRIKKIVEPFFEVTSGKNVAIFSDSFRVGGVVDIVESLGMNVVGVGVLDRVNESKKRICDSLKTVLNSNDYPVLQSPTREKVREFVLNLKNSGQLDLIIGTSVENIDTQDLQIPFVEFGFPSHYYHALFPSPYILFNGYLNVANRIVNSLVKKLVFDQSAYYV